MTEEELLNQFLTTPDASVGEVAVEEVSEPTEDGAENALLARYLSPEPKKEVVKAVAEAATPNDPTFLDRALPRAQLAISDAMTTTFGDTFGRGGDEQTQKTDWIGPDALSPERRIAAGADLGRGAGDIFTDAYETFVPKMAQRGLAATMDWMGKNQGEHPIYGNVGIDSARADIAEISPRLGAIADDAAIVGSTLAGLKLPKARSMVKAGTLGKVDNFGDNIAQKLRDRKTNLRQADIADRMLPDDPYGIPGEVKEVGFSKTTKYTPDDARQTMYDDIDSVEALNPRESVGNNWKALDTEVGRLRSKLDRNLRLEDYTPTQELKNLVEQSILEIEDFPVMKGSVASEAAKAVYAQVEKIIDKYDVNGGIKPGQMLDVRRELDNWLKLNDPKVFEGQSLSGTTLAIQAVRKAINGRVAEVAPDKDVAEALRKQSSLLTARDELLVKANRQGKNRFSRAIQQTQERLGLSLPHSPAAVGANTELIPLSIGTAGTAYTHGGRLGGNIIKPQLRALEKLAARGWDYGKGPLTVAEMNRLQQEENK